jgi:WhiB family redox-sensing transcriptional regulator
MIKVTDLYLDLDTANSEDPEDWMAYGRCAEVDPESFFPEKGGSSLEPKRVCMGCDVRQKCLDWAIETDQKFGIWGGLSERQRRKLRQEREAA